MGAWIETAEGAQEHISEMSHPMWVRGLKHTHVYKDMKYIESHPMWVRGLKLLSLPVILHLLVAPYVGAWIETMCNVSYHLPNRSRTLCGCVD